MHIPIYITGGIFMKKYLLPESGKFYKANLHCHTNISDGRCTPEEIKELYKAQGYSVVAYTDHDLMIPHHDLSDEDFIAMTGYEMEINEPNKEWPKLKTCHICFVALSPEIDKQVCWNRETLGYTFPQSHELAKKYAKFDENEPDFVREYSKECISTMMKKGRDAGFFVTYNHPTWSNQHQSDYSGYENMHAMEIVNYGCQAMGYDEYNPHVYDDMLNLGKQEGARSEPF